MFYYDDLIIIIMNILIFFCFYSIKVSIIHIYICLYMFILYKLNAQP